MDKLTGPGNRPRMAPRPRPQAERASALGQAATQQCGLSRHLRHRMSYPLNNSPLPTSYPQLGITFGDSEPQSRCGAMSRVNSRRCSDHQVINTVNNPVETHRGRSAARSVRPPPRAGVQAWGGDAPHALAALRRTGCWAAWRARVCGVQSGPERDRAGPVREP